MKATEADMTLADDAAGLEAGRNSRYAGIELRCPRCTGGIPDLHCHRCGFVLRENRGIIHALPPERVAHYARFIEEYEHVREAEGRGSENDSFYLDLPYHDSSARNSHHWHIRARTFDHLLEHVLKPHCSPGNRILDLGAGNCWLSYRLCIAGYRPVAVDLLTNDRDGLGAAEHYRSYLPDFFLRLRAELGRLPFQSGQFDSAVFNASFHYAENYEEVLHEALRCVRKGGLVIICDTPWYRDDADGRKMVTERRAKFLEQFGTASASIEHLEYLTDERLRSMEKQLSIRWMIFRPHYGLKWAMRPLIAKLRKRREPARFRIYVTQKVYA